MQLVFFGNLLKNISSLFFHAGWVIRLHKEVCLLSNVFRNVRRKSTNAQSSDRQDRTRKSSLFLQVVKYLIEKHADVNKRGRDSKGSGVTALHLATEGGFAEIVSLLVNAHCNVDEVTFECCSTGFYCPTVVPSSFIHVVM